jgi:hypothetical protein
MAITPQDFVNKRKRAEARERQSVFAAYGWESTLSDE